MRVVVVGAGIMGASIAWHLTRSGAEVIVVGSGAPAASAASFGWINASFFHDAAHHRLRAEGLSAHRRLLDALPDVPLSFPGALWWEAQGADLQAFKDQLSALDYPVAALQRAEVQTLEPAIAGLPEEALLFHTEGVADPGRVASDLIRQSGAKMIRGVRVTGITGARSVTAVETEIGPIAADKVVVAAGNGAPDILRSVGITLPMLRRPGVMVMTKPVTARLSHTLVTPHGELRQLPDGRLMASAVANHQGDDSEDVIETPEAIAARVLAWLDPMIRDERVEWDEVTLAHRPVPQDGLPVIGSAGPEGLHVAVMHSGVTLAAIAGEVTAAQVLGTATNAQMALVAPYGPERFVG
ncbi:MAG: FAD-dependent oxidoreductase [Pseudomonadota bacterium]